MSDQERGWTPKPEDNRFNQPSLDEGEKIWNEGLKLKGGKKKKNSAEDQAKALED
jgi:hypothetical protein